MIKRQQTVLILAILFVLLLIFIISNVLTTNNLYDSSKYSLRYLEGEALKKYHHHHHRHDHDDHHDEKVQEQRKELEEGKQNLEHDQEQLEQVKEDEGERHEKSCEQRALDNFKARSESVRKASSSYTIHELRHLRNKNFKFWQDSKNQLLLSDSSSSSPPSLVQQLLNYKLRVAKKIQKGENSKLWKPLFDATNGLLSSHASKSKKGSNRKSSSSSSSIRDGLVQESMKELWGISSDNNHNNNNNNNNNNHHSASVGSHIISEYGKTCFEEFPECSLWIRDEILLVTSSLNSFKKKEEDAEGDETKKRKSKRGKRRVLQLSENVQNTFLRHHSDNNNNNTNTVVSRSTLDLLRRSGGVFLDDKSSQKKEGEEEEEEKGKRRRSSHKQQEQIEEEHESNLENLRFVDVFFGVKCCHEHAEMKKALKWAYSLLLSSSSSSNDNQDDGVDLDEEVARRRKRRNNEKNEEEEQEHQNDNSLTIDLSLTAGSLLASVREVGGYMVPWDTDVDLLIQPKDESKVRQILKDHEQHDQEVGKGSKRNIYAVAATKLVDPPLQHDHGRLLGFIYGTTQFKHEEASRVEIWVAQESKKMQKKEIVLPLQKCMLQDVIVECPNNVEAVLSAGYNSASSSWCQPCKSRSSNCKK